MLHPDPALSHGGIPAVIGVAAGEELTPVSSFGVWLPGENEDFHLLCEEAYQGVVLPPVAREPNGDVRVGLFKGVLTYDPTDCSRTTHTLEGELLFVRALTYASDGALMAVTSSGGKANGLFQYPGEGEDWKRVPLPIEDGFFTSLVPDEEGWLTTLAFRIEPETNQRDAFGCYQDQTGWTCTEVESHGVPEREQPFLLDCHSEWGCLITWEGDPENGLYQWKPETGAVELRAVFPEAPEDRPGQIPSSTWGAVFLKDGTILVNRGEELYQVGETTNPEQLADLPPIRCIEKRENAIILCSDPFAQEGFALATWDEETGALESLLPDYNALSDSVGCPEPDGIDIDIVCGKPWNEMQQTLGLTPSQPSIPREEPPDPIPDAPVERMVEDAVQTESIERGGCRSGKTAFPGGWIMVIGCLLMGSRTKRILLLACMALLLGCGGEGSEPADSPEVSQEITGEEEREGDSADAAEEPIFSKPDLVGLALLGEYTQVLADGTETKGVISNVVFARPEELVPAFDQTVGDCSFREVAADTEIQEPLGFSGGILTLSGEGVGEEIQFTPFDFGEAAGGFAYDTSLEDGIAAIFADEGLVEISNEGSDDFPPLAGELSVPGSAPSILPIPGPITPDNSGSARYTWTPEGGDNVLFEWDSFLPDGSAAQLRCSFPDERGEATIPSEFLDPFLSNPFTMSIARTSEKEWSEGPSILRATLTRRTVTFVFP